jgi:hypothetical protein
MMHISLPDMMNGSNNSMKKRFRSFSLLFVGGLSVSIFFSFPWLRYLMILLSMTFCIIRLIWQQHEHSLKQKRFYPHRLVSGNDGRENGKKTFLLI